MSSVTQKKELVGIEPVSYTKDGQVHFGTRLYIQFPLASPSVGVKFKDEYIPNVNSTEFHLGPIEAVLYEPGYGGKMRCTGVLYEK